MNRIAALALAGVYLSACSTPPASDGDAAVEEKADARAAGPDAGPPPPDAASGVFGIVVPLAIDPAAVGPGQTITGSVTYENGTAVAVQIRDLVIAARPPGGTHSGGPYLDLTPAHGPGTVQPGERVAHTATRTFSASDAIGRWEAYATYQDSAGVWQDGPSVFFDVLATPVDAGVRPDAASARPDAASPGADAGTGPGLDASAGSADAGAGVGSNAMGINLGSPLDWEGNRLYADLIKTSREPEVTGGGTRVTVDADGWPTVNAFDVFVAALDRLHGTYALSFKGTATVSVPYGPGATVSGATYDAASNTTTATIVATDPTETNWALRFNDAWRDAAKTQPGLKDIKLMRPTAPGSSTPFASTVLFNTPLQALAKKFSVLRFMDFTATNWSQQVNWADRALPRHMSYQRLSGENGYGWQGRGGPWEHVVLFANEVQRDAWINIPAKATDDYITKVAQLFAYGSDGEQPYTSPQANPVFPPLAPNLRLYVEYSNEIWNFGFGQYNDVDAMAKATTGGPIHYDGEDLALPRFAVMRAAQVSLIFRKVFGDAAMMTRIRPVFETQAAWPGGPVGSVVALNFMFNYFANGDGTNLPSASWVVPGTSTQVGPQPPGYYFYGAGGATYYNPNDISSVNACLTSGDMDAATWMGLSDDHFELRDMLIVPSFGVRRVAYEGGPSMDFPDRNDPNGFKAAAVMTARPASPNMTDVVKAHHTIWSQKGGDLFVYFQAAGGYEWGFAPLTADGRGDIYDLDSPKLKAIDELNAEARAAITLGTAIPGGVNGAAHVLTANWYQGPFDNFGATGGKALDGSAANSAWNATKWVSYLFHAGDTASRTVQVQLSNASGNVGVYLDGALLESKPATNGTVSFAAGSVGPGMHGVIVRAVGGTLTVDRVEVQ